MLANSMVSATDEGHTGHALKIMHFPQLQIKFKKRRRRKYKVKRKITNWKGIYNIDDKELISLTYRTS